MALSSPAAVLSVLTRRCLQGRIDQRPTVSAEAAAWAGERNRRHVGVDWHFTTADTRMRLKNLYPTPRE